MDRPSETPTAIDFRRFRVLLRRRELVADKRPLELGGRAFDVLMALIEARRAVVSKAALIQRVWSGRVVEENSLQVQISALRKVLAPDCDLIRTVAGRGYQFIGVARTVSTSTDAAPSATTSVPLLNSVRAPTKPAGTGVQTDRPGRRA